MKLSGEAVRQQLRRRDLAMTAYLRGLAGCLRLADSELHAILHLSCERELTPSQLAARCRLTSGGTAALVARLEAAGYVTRRPHPRDRRSSLLRLVPAVAELVGRADAVLDDRLERITAELREDEEQAVTRILAALVTTAEELAASVAPEAPATRLERLTPSLWA